MRFPLPAAIALAALTALPALAQADHSHHSAPVIAAAVVPPVADTTGHRPLAVKEVRPAMKMGSGMMKDGGMMKMMMGMQDCPARDPDALKTALEITPAQLSLWTPFAEALKAVPPMMDGKMMTMSGDKAGLPARLHEHEKMLDEHLAAMRKLTAALDPLYAAFTPTQKARADALICGGGMTMAKAD